MALQRPETPIDGAIRDNYPVRIGLGNLKDENFQDGISHAMIQ